MNQAAPPRTAQPGKTESVRIQTANYGVIERVFE